MRVYCRAKPLQSSYQIVQADQPSNQETPRLSQMVEQAVLRPSTDPSLENCIKLGATTQNQTNQGGPKIHPTSLQICYSEREVYNYFMDGIFASNSSQEEIFEEIKPFV